MEVFDGKTADRISKCGNIAVVVIGNADKAVDLANTLLAGGVSVMELTLRTDVALDAIGRIASQVPDMLVGAGTVLTVDQLRRARDAGAAFAVAPGFNPATVGAAIEMGFSFAPGVMTPSEIEGAVGLGCRLLKYFPAGAIGGLKPMQALVAPYAHLGLRYIPLGGITPETTAEYLASPIISACGGSWIAPQKLVDSGDWKTIRSNAAQASAIAQSARCGW